MNLYNNSMSEQGSPYQRLLRSLTGAMSAEGKTPAGRQSKAINNEVIKRIYGEEGHQFKQAYKNFEDNYFHMLSDESNRARFGNFRGMQAERASGIINLSLLNVESQNQLKNAFKSNVLRLPNLFEEVGIPRNRVSFWKPLL
jgi:hypothetical protein